MALRPIPGHPGKFQDDTGRVVDISDFREDDKYDTIAIAAGAIAAGTQAIFYRDVAAKRLIDTNLTQQSRLSAGEEMVINRVGVTVRNASGNLFPPVADIKRITDDGFIRFEVNRLLLVEGPVIKFPSGYGLAGIDGTATGLVSVGVPSTASAAKLAQTQLITSNHEILATLTFFDRNWATVQLVAGNEMPTLTTPVLVTAWLHGLVKAAVSK